MNKNILARNILILDQISEISKALSEKNIPFILLKGAALIELFPDYMGKREMEDIDLLFSPKDMVSARDIICSLGYRASYKDPWAFYNEQKTAYVDICDGIWYLNKNENKKLFNNALEYPTNYPMGFYLAPDDFFIHIFAHAAVHHMQKKDSWIEDLKLIKGKWQGDLNWEIINSKLKRYGLDRILNIYLSDTEFISEFKKNNHKNKFLLNYYDKFLNKQIPQKGHIARFIFLPLKKKFMYLFNTIFPSKIFIKYRYSLNNGFQIFIFQLIRPIFLLFALIKFGIRSLIIKY